VTNPFASHLDIRPNLDVAPFDDLDRNTLLHGGLNAIGLLPEGTSGGRASVAMVATLDDGRKVVVECTWRLLRSAARVLNASPLGQAEAEADGTN
jgi:hypothetical protein